MYNQLILCPFILFTIFSPLLVSSSSRFARLFPSYVSPVILVSLISFFSGDRIPVGARFSAPLQTGPEAHPAFCTMGTGSFPWLNSGQGVTLTLHAFSCRGQERVELYVYSPSAPYGLCRASVPVQVCTLPFLISFFWIIAEGLFLLHLLLALQPSVNLSLSQNCPSLLSVLLRTSPVPHPQVL